MQRIPSRYPAIRTTNPVGNDGGLVVQLHAISAQCSVKAQGVLDSLRERLKRR